MNIEKMLALKYILTFGHNTEEMMVKCREIKIVSVFGSILQKCFIHVTKRAIKKCLKGLFKRIVEVKHF